ncbi:hypothetical protein CR513_54058, partial [Mucuna pruriens]
MIDVLSNISPREVVLYVDPKNIVHIVTNNVANYVGVDKAMVTSKELTSSTYAKEAKAKKFVEQWTLIVSPLHLLSHYGSEVLQELRYIPLLLGMHLTKCGWKDRPH